MISGKQLQHVKKQWSKCNEKKMFGHFTSKHISMFVKPNGSFLNTSSGHILYGINRPRTHTMMKDFKRKNVFKSHEIFGENLYLHSEIDLISKTIQSWRTDDLSDLTMLICRFNNNGDGIYSCPCSGCKLKMSQFKIDNYYHT